MDTIKILLDTPATKPALGFDITAGALAQLIAQSEPRFAVGIFGGWGSGKTTLMQAIERQLPSEKALTVSFNAWRYEREPHLIVPLLDTVRGALMEWSAHQSPVVRERIVGIARKVGRVVRALASGLSGEIEIPGFAKLTYDVNQAMEGLSPVKPEEPETPQSLYYACFELLNDAFAQLHLDGIERIVVFVDDLDRCLPASTLDVIESMKLFFDLPGFVFVVGIDQFVLEQAVRARIADVSGASAGQPGRAGARRNLLAEREYVKKIFQLPYELPPMAAEQLDALLATIYEASGLEGAQLQDFTLRVRPYLAHIAVDGHVNPREVKRFLNAYTLQMLVRPYLDRDIVLAVQTLAFRDDWPLYDTLRLETDALPGAIASYRGGENSALVDLWPEIGSLPTDLARFLRSPQAAPLAGGDLRKYLTSVDSTARPARWLDKAYSLVGGLRRITRSLPAIVEQENPTQAIERLRQDLSDGINRLTSLITEVDQIDRLMEYLGELHKSNVAVHSGMTRGGAENWLKQVDATLEEIQRELRLLRGLGFSSVMG